MRGGRSGRDIPKAEAGAHARQTMFLPQTPEGVLRASAPSIRRSLAGWHARIIRLGALPALYWPPVRQPDQRTNGAPEPRAPPSLGPPAGPTGERSFKSARFSRPPARWSASRTKGRTGRPNRRSSVGWSASRTNWRTKLQIRPDSARPPARWSASRTKGRTGRPNRPFLRLLVRQPDQLANEAGNPARFSPPTRSLVR